MTGRPPTRGELLLRGFMQGGALALLAMVIWIADGHLDGLVALLSQCTGRPGG